MRKKNTQLTGAPAVVMQRVVGALAKEWTGIARELVEDTTELPMLIRQLRAREIQLCRWHAKQLRKALRKCSNAAPKRAELVEAIPPAFAEQ